MLLVSKHNEKLYSTHSGIVPEIGSLTIWKVQEKKYIYPLEALYFESLPEL